MTDRPDADLTIAAVGTSVTWGTGNNYENKFVDLVHRDLNGGYPLEEKYLHYNTGEEPSEPRYPYSPAVVADYPTPSYYSRTVDDGYTIDSERDEEHPRGPHIPPSQFRARGGAIMGLDWPPKVVFGKKDPSDVERNDNGGYLDTGPDGEYDGKLDGLGRYSQPHDDIFPNDGDINTSAWLTMRDIGWGWPTIPEQIRQFGSDGSGWREPADMPRQDDPSFSYSFASSPPPGDEVDLVLIDGGTNDMQLGWINNPTKAGRPKLRKAAELYLYDNMTGRDGMLQRARRAFPNAVIVLIGYPVWTSNRTDNGRALGFLREISPAASWALEGAIDNPLIFSHLQAHWLRRAVAEESRKDDGPGMLFAQPPYGIVNSMMADWPWSYGFHNNRHGKSINPRRDEVSLDIGVTPSDTVQKRVEITDAERNWEYNADNDCDSPGLPRAVGSKKDCEIDTPIAYGAPIGHPNNEGSRQYADTIVRRYKQYVDLSVGSVGNDLDAGTDKLRKSLERYQLDAASDGLHWSLSHRIVDSLRVEVATNSGQGMGRKRGEAYLSIYPGRHGQVERFRLDTEYNDHAPGSEDEFFIDPMMRKRISGPIGNVDDAEIGVGTGVDEPSNQTLEPIDHWSNQRLRLGDIEHATLNLKNVDPIDGWDIDEVTLEINGILKRTRDFAKFDNKDTRGRREFLVAEFNHVDGVSANDLSIDITNEDVQISSGRGKVSMDFEVENPTSERVPSVAVQYGVRVETNREKRMGRQWQVWKGSDLDPGGTKSVGATVWVDDVRDVKTNPVHLHAGVAVDSTINWTSVTTSK